MYAPAPSCMVHFRETVFDACAMYVVPLRAVLYHWLVLYAAC
jgi:hypothetical protein